MEKVNVYDWDKTIFPVDSTVAFVRWCLRRHPGVIRALLGTLVLLPGYWLGKVSKTAIKERMYGFLRRVPDVNAVSCAAATGRHHNLRLAGVSRAHSGAEARRAAAGLARG